MKTIHNYKYLFLFGIISLFVSCSEEGFTDPISHTDPNKNSWVYNTNLNISAKKDKEAFLWLKNVLTLEEYWGNDEVTLDVNLNSEFPISNIDKIDFYFTAQEKDGYNYTAPFDTEGVFFKSINSWDEEGKFTLNIEGESIYSLFTNKFKFNRASSLVREGDLFELHWVIYGKDGKIKDSRKSVEGNSRYGIAAKRQDFAPPVFEGNFIRTWTYIPPGSLFSLVFGSKFVTGLTENCPIENLGGGDYKIDFTGYGLTTGATDDVGIINFNFTSGLLTVKYGPLGDKYKVTNVSGDTLTIDWTCAYSGAPYFIYGTFTLKRTDGANWPTNIYTN